MPRRGTVIVLLLSLVALVSAVVLAPGAASYAPANRAPFPAGVYIGKTSQGNPVRLRLTIGGACGREVPCLYASNRQEGIHIVVPCPDGSNVNTFLAVPPGGVAKNGVVHDFQENFEETFSAEIFAVFSVSTRGVVRGEIPITVRRKDGSECSGRATLVAKVQRTPSTI